MGMRTADVFHHILVMIQTLSNKYEGFGCFKGLQMN